MDKGGTNNLMKIVQAETKVALPALKEVFETQWNKQYPGTKWSYDAASVTLFDKKKEELFEKNLNGLSKSKSGNKHSQRKGLDDEEWKRGNWDISKLAYALIDSKLFRLDETDDAGTPISEHIAEIRNIRNKSAHHSNSQCSKKDSDNTLDSLSKHIKAFKDFIEVDKYVALIECIRSEEAPLSPEERYSLQLDLINLRFSNQIYEIKEQKLQLELEFSIQICEQKEKTHEERQKRCELYTIIIAFQKENECLKDKLEHKDRELARMTHELELVKLTQTRNEENKRLMSEDDANRHKKCTQKNPPLLNNHNIQVRQSEISSGVLMRSNTESDSRRNARSYERVVSSEISRGKNKNGSKRNAYSWDLLKLMLPGISNDSEEIRRLKTNQISKRRPHSDDLQKQLKNDQAYREMYI